MESAARTIVDFGEKQHFLNSVYERFFRGYSVKVADTHGIVYTPQQIVRYMCNAVEAAFKRRFVVDLSRRQGLPKRKAEVRPIRGALSPGQGRSDGS